MALQQDRLFAFSGLMFAGKDYVAQQLGLTIVGFADPLYEMSEYFNGTRDKSVPGVRRFLQQAGQWGWGCVNEQNPHSMERAVFVQQVRRFGKDVTQNFKWVDWSEYGKRKDFWVNILLTRMGLVDSEFDIRGRPPFRNIAITNVRFDHELQPLRKASFQHYHVMCSERTRQARMEAKGYTWKPAELADTSEQLALRMPNDLPPNRIIWNDTEVSMPKSYLCLDQVKLLDYAPVTDVADAKYYRPESAIAN